jgi:hypothetical protein
MEEDTERVVYLGTISSDYKYIVEEGSTMWKRESNHIRILIRHYSSQFRHPEREYIQP